MKRHIFQVFKLEHNTVHHLRTIGDKMMSTTLTVFLTVFLINFANSNAKIDPQELKCLVCEKTVDEIGKFVNKLDPNVKVDVGGYRLDSDGNFKGKSVSQRRSEVQLSDIMDKVCSKMDDYVRATWKDSGKLTLLKLIDENGKMSLDMGSVDIIQDDDLNKSLKYYCEGLIEEYEESIISSFIESEDDITNRICAAETNYCINSSNDIDDEL